MSCCFHFWHCIRPVSQIVSIEWVAFQFKQSAKRDNKQIFCWSFSSQLHLGLTRWPLIASIASHLSIASSMSGLLFRLNKVLWIEILLEKSVTPQSFCHDGDVICSSKEMQWIQLSAISTVSQPLSLIFIWTIFTRTNLILNRVNNHRRPILCTVSTRNVIAYTADTEITDSELSLFTGFYVYVADLNTPWHSYK